MASLRGKTKTQKTQEKTQNFKNKNLWKTKKPTTSLHAPRAPSSTANPVLPAWSGMTLVPIVAAPLTSIIFNPNPFHATKRNNHHRQTRTWKINVLPHWKYITSRTTPSKLGNNRLHRTKHHHRNQQRRYRQIPHVITKRTRNTYLTSWSHWRRPTHPKGNSKNIRQKPWTHPSTWSKSTWKNTSDNNH